MHTPATTVTEYTPKRNLPLVFISGTLSRNARASMLFDIEDAVVDSRIVGLPTSNILDIATCIALG